jgi:hypothetical protein
LDRTPVYKRLPKIWRDLDEQGVLERYLSVWDAAFWKAQQKVTDLLDTRNIVRVPDKFLVLPSTTVGHRWKNYKSYQWNRSRSSHDITKYSYNGTELALEDLVREHGGLCVEVIDMASKVAVWSRQGTYTDDDDNFYDADYFHPGVFVLTVTDDIDMEHFLEDFEYWKPAGTKWYIRLMIKDGVYIPIDIDALSGVE